MFKAFFGSRKWLLWAYGVGGILLASLVLQVHIQVLLNGWRGDFGDLLQEIIKHPGAQGAGVIYTALWQFLKLAGIFAFFAVSTNACARFYSFAWREAIFKDYLPRWANTPNVLEGECQRLQEDAKRFASTLESLGLSILRAVITLISFLPLLWTLSSGVSITMFETIPEVWTNMLLAAGVVGILLLTLRKGYLSKSGLWYIVPEKVLLWLGLFVGVSFYVLANGLHFLSVTIPPLSHMPGSLVWVALYVTLGGMIISWYVGSRLPGLEYNNQKVEASLRTELEMAVRFKQKGEALPTLLELFTGVRRNYWRLFTNYAYFDVWSIMFSQSLVIIPYLIMAPRFAAGLITLGVLNRIGSAFDSVQGSFSVLIDNWTTVTELRSIHKRLREFENNLSI